MPLARYCSTCDDFHPEGVVCKRRERQRYTMSRQRRIRSTARWQRARAEARRRDGNRCACGKTRNLQVHHIVSLEDGGDPFALNNLITVCARCHSREHGGMGSRRAERVSHPSPVFRETNWHDAPLVG
jgi:5-methylcytosine-specific restriction endonuclease McrA